MVTRMGFMEWILHANFTSGFLLPIIKQETNRGIPHAALGNTKDILRQSCRVQALLDDL